MGQTLEKRHYAAIDGLRTFAAVGIVLMHVLGNGKYALSGFVPEHMIPSCTNLVFLFMIISGFAVCCGYHDKIINNKITLAQFYGKRFAKTWPFFALLCLVELCISPSVGALNEVFANLTLCHGLFTYHHTMSVIGVGWFLGVVFLFYLLFPFYAYLISDKKRAWFSFAVTLAFNLFCSDYFDLGRRNIMYCAVFFLAGGLIYLYREPLQKFSEKYRLLAFLPCVALTVVYYFFEGSSFIMLIVFSLYLIYAIGNTRTSILNNPVTKFFSGISMEVYLSHMMIYRILEKIGIVYIFGKGILSYIAVCIAT